MLDQRQTFGLRCTNVIQMLYVCWVAIYMYGPMLSQCWASGAVAAGPTLRQDWVNATNHITSIDSSLFI